MDTLRDTAEAVRIVRALSTGAWPHNAMGADVVKTYQRALAAVGLYDPGDDDEWIDGDAGWMTRFAHAQAIAAVRGIGTWAYESNVPIVSDAAQWARDCRAIGLDGVIFMLSDVEDAIAARWRLEHGMLRYVEAARVAMDHGLQVAVMPWVTPHRDFMAAMRDDVLELCRRAGIYDAHADAEGPWRRRGDADHGVLANDTVLAWAAEGIRTGISGYPSMAIAGGMDRPGIVCTVECDVPDNDTIDPWSDTIVEVERVGPSDEDEGARRTGKRPGCLSPQCYSQFDEDHASSVYEPGRTQQYAASRWGLHQVGDCAERWIALAAYRQHTRPKWSTAKHMGVAYTAAVELGSHAIPYWNRWWIEHGPAPEVRAFTSGVARRRRHFLELARAA